MTSQCGRSVVQVLVVRVDIKVVIYEAMTSQCGRSVVQVLVVRVDIGVVIYEAMTPQCGRSVVQVLVVRVNIGVVTYEAMTSQCGRSVIQVLAVGVDIGVLICVCLCVFLHDNSECNRYRNMKLNDNISKKFDIEHCRIKVKVTVCLKRFSQFTTIQTVRSYNSTLVQARKLKLESLY